MLGIDPRVARATWTVIAIALLCLATYAIRQTLFMFIVALLFAYLLLPVIDFIDRVLPGNQTRGLALAVVYLLLVGGIGIIGAEIGARGTEQANNLAQKISDFLKPEATDENLPLPQPLKPISARLLSVVRVQIQAHYQELLQKLPQAAFKTLGAFANVLVIVIVPILSFFFLKDGRALQRSIVNQVSDPEKHRLLAEIAGELNVLLAQYMRALVLLGLVTGITYGAFFEIIGVPYAILLAVIAFPLEFIPMLGPVVSTTIILLVTGFSGPHRLIPVIIFLAVFRIVQDYVISPHLMSAGMQLHPLLVIFGVFAGEQMAGVPGAFLSVPVMAVLRMLYRRLERARLLRSEQLVETVK